MIPVVCGFYRVSGLKLYPMVVLLSLLLHLFHKHSGKQRRISVPAVFSSLDRRRPRISAATAIAMAANFLQKQQNQRGPSRALSGSELPRTPMPGLAEPAASLFYSRVRWQDIFDPHPEEYEAFINMVVAAAKAFTPMTPPHYDRLSAHKLPH
jgi:hypothetical protein